MVVNTIAQYKCLQWIMERFNQDALNVEIVDSVTLRITDENKEQALIHWHSQEGITLLGIEKSFVLGKVNDKYIVFRKEQEDEIVEANDYAAIKHIQEFISEIEAYEKLRVLTESEDWSDEE